MASRFPYCTDLVKLSDEDRYLGALFAPQDKRDALIAIYAFNIEVGKIRESVSEPMLGQIRLQWWREAIEGIYNGTPRKHEVIDALAEVIPAYQLPRDLFETYLDAREKDLEEDPFANYDALITYIEGTAGIILRMSARVLCPERDFADHLINQPAIAWALIGMIRALPFALHKRWLFIPKTVQEEHVVSAYKCFAGQAHEGLSAALRELRQRGQAEWENTRRDLKDYPTEFYPVLLPLKLLPKYITHLQADAYDPFTTLIEISPTKKRLSVMWMMLSGRL